MTRTLFAATLVIALVATTVSSAVAAPISYGRYLVVTDIEVKMVNTEAPWPGRLCTVEGVTGQELVTAPGGPEAQLGTGRPHFNYPWNRGPFRDTTLTPILFVCGDEVSACFHPSTVRLNPAGAIVVSLEFTLYKGSGLSFACDPADLLDREAVTLVAEGPLWCLPKGSVHLEGPEGDVATIWNYCVRVTYLGPAPSPFEISSLVCLSFDGAFSCDIMTSGAVAPLQYQWTVNGVHDPAFDNLATVTGPCPAGAFVDVEVVVRDAMANLAQRSARHRCR
jgi:hypothetical protein